MVSFRCKCGGWLRGLGGYMDRKRYDRRGCKVCGLRRGVAFEVSFKVLKGGRVRRYKRGRCCLVHSPKLNGALSYVENRERWQSVFSETWHPTPLFVGLDWCACVEDGKLFVYGREHGIT